MGNAYLKEKYEEALSARDAFTASMGDDFDARMVERLMTLQAMVKSAKEQFDSAESAGISAAPGDVCQVTLRRGGKETRRVEIPVGTTVVELMNLVNWTTTETSFEKVDGAGASVEVLDLNSSSVFPEKGEYTLHALPKTAGGLL